MKTAIAVLQTVWDCRWSQPGLRFWGTAERDQPEPDWVCIRTGERRAVSNEQCEHCPHWQRDDTRWT